MHAALGVLGLVPALSHPSLRRCCTFLAGGVPSRTRFRVVKAMKSVLAWSDGPGSQAWHSCACGVGVGWLGGFGGFDLGGGGFSSGPMNACLATETVAWYSCSKR